MRTFISFSLKVIIFLCLIAAGYYFVILKPQLAFMKEKQAVIKSLELHKDMLTENKLAFVQLAKIPPNSPELNNEVKETTAKIKETNKKGLEMQDESGQSGSEKFKDIRQKLPDLFSRTKDIYNKQNEILKKVFETKKYEDGVTILKSQESVNLITKQTNLILEYEFLIKRSQYIK